MIALALACIVFSLGLYAVLSRRDVIGILVGVEIMLGGGSVLLSALGAASGAPSGSIQGIGLMVLLIAAAEAAVGLSLLLMLYRTSGRSRIDELSEVSG